MGRHRTFRLGGSNGSAAKRSAGRALDRIGLTVRVLSKALEEAGPLKGRAARVGCGGKEIPKSGMAH